MKSLTRLEVRFVRSRSTTVSSDSLSSYSGALLTATSFSFPSWGNGGDDEQRRRTSNSNEQQRERRVLVSHPTLPSVPGLAVPGRVSAHPLATQSVFEASSAHREGSVPSHELKHEPTSFRPLRGFEFSSSPRLRRPHLLQIAFSFHGATLRRRATPDRSSSSQIALKKTAGRI